MIIWVILESGAYVTVGLPTRARLAAVWRRRATSHWQILPLFAPVGVIYRMACAWQGYTLHVRVCMLLWREEERSVEARVSWLRYV